MSKFRHPKFPSIRATSPSRYAFTLLELLVVMAIIALLVGLVLVALRSARRGSDRAASLNALKGMTTAYITYATEHDGMVMPGYIDPTELPGQNVNVAAGQLDIRAKLKTGFLLDSDDSASYVWRLAPYLDHDWGVYMRDYGDKELNARFEAEYGDGTAGGAYGPGSASAAQLGISRTPSYGLNSVHLGGDSFHGPRPDNAPWRGGKRRIVAARMSEVLNPTKIIVFGATRMEPAPPSAPFDIDSIAGYCELRAPFANNDANNDTFTVAQWSIDATSGLVVWNGGAGGTPCARLGDDKVPISHLDGHVEAEALSRLAVDMSRWAPNAISTQ